MSSPNYRIFLVDDDSKHLMLLKSHIEKKSDYNLEISIFSSGENCLQKLNENPDIIILDYYLDSIKPDAKNGLDILKQIKDVNPDITVLMMSSQDELQIALDTLSYGAYDYMIKNDSAFVRAQLLIDHILEMKSTMAWMEDVKGKHQKMVVAIVLLLIAVVVLGIKTLI